MLLVQIALLVLATKDASSVRINTEEERVAAFVDGQFIVGVLLPLHYAPPSENKNNESIKCGRIREQYGIQRVEAVFHTVDRINADPHLLPNLTLGVEIRDDCWYAPVALQQTLEFIRAANAPSASQWHSCFNLSGALGPNATLIGVVGPGSSSTTIEVQNLLQVFHIAQIGYSATSRHLSDKKRYNYFLRVVPSDKYQAQVMFDICKYHNWTYVSIVKTDESYGQSGSEAFRKLAEAENVCVADEHSILSDAREEEFDKVVMKLKNKSAIHVVCFCEGMTARKLLNATRRCNLTNHFLFIGSDGWGDRRDVTYGLNEEAWGSISVRIHTPPPDPDFKDYYLSLRPATNARNPWFGDFWESRFNCTLSPIEPRLGLVSRPFNRTCTEKEMSTSRYSQDSKLSFVIKAIYTFAHGLHNLQQDVCKSSAAGLCDDLRATFNKSLFKEYLMNVSFDYADEKVEFNHEGDPPGRYDVLNFQKIGDKYEYVEVAHWSNNTLTWNETRVQFGIHGEVAKCTPPCEKGYYKKMNKCCWVCVKCPDGEVLNVSDYQSCYKCPAKKGPDKDQMKCFDLVIKYLSWSDPEAIVSMVFAAMGLSSTLLSLVVFTKYKNTPVVKSSTRELCFIILAGMAISHVSVFSIIAKPSKFTCLMNRLLPGLSFAVIYSALLTKTNRIARILSDSKIRIPSSKPRFMSATAQVVITSFLITIEVFIATWMLHSEPPSIKYRDLPDKSLLECDVSVEGLLTPLAFDFFLIVLCTLYALKTRNVPENFNEAKFIGFAMYTTCVIWVAFIPIYFGSDSKVIAMSMCVTLSALITWIFIFIPKIYIILLQPERNNRALFTTSKSIRCHIGNRVASAIAEKTSTSNHSWKEENCKEEIHKRTLSCQTGAELIEVWLRPEMLVCGHESPLTTKVPRITERKCCQTDSCQLKNITIKLPRRP